MGHRVYVQARRWLGAILLGGAALLGAGGAAAADAPVKLGNYELGRGLALGATGFTLGGYATARYEDSRHADPRFSLDHLSLMLWWEGTGRWKFFSEADMEQGLSTRRDNREDDRFYSLERAYLDYALTDSVTLRGGKFLTPIGRWNLIHADPLVWTTSRPMVTDQVFPTSSTGGMLLGTLPLGERDLDYSLFLAGSKEWRAKPSEDPFSEARGLHVNLPLTDDLQVGASYASFEQEADRNDRKHLGGVDFLWVRARWEASGEAVYRSSSRGAGQAEKGGYLQLVAPLTDRLYAVGRGEVFHFAGASETAHVWVLGLNYRYARAISLKAELVSGEKLPPQLANGFLASVSVLF